MSRIYNRMHRKLYYKIYIKKENNIKILILKKYKFAYIITFLLALLVVSKQKIFVKLLVNNS